MNLRSCQALTCLSSAAVNSTNSVGMTQNRPLEHPVLYCMHKRHGLQQLVIVHIVQLTPANQLNPDRGADEVGGVAKWKNVGL